MEKFIVSARKYRPQTFDTVVGQQHITTTLKNAILHNQLAHAFLFCGPRGVGKTTCARILAKTINCENLQPNGEACDTCVSCRTFNEGTSLNIHELDAASNNSVDDIRNLTDQVRFAPQMGKYKVYIVDEVHMLSPAAFNAFLKTLEEPPSYAIFILATTEKHKILPTILSRCQIFDFKRITLHDTVAHLRSIAEKEHIQAEDAALQVIAQKSEGCMRDALSILDKIVSFTNGTVTYANTLEHLNILDADYFFQLLACMQQQDVAGAMLLYDTINAKGFEGDLVLNNFSEFLRNLLVCKDPKMVHLLEAVESFRDRYVTAAAQTGASWILSALNVLNEAEINYKQARNKRLHVELALIKLTYLQQALDLSTGKKKLNDEGKVLHYRALRPVKVQEAPPPPAATTPGNGARLLIETPAPEPPRTAPAAPPAKPAAAAGAVKTGVALTKLSRLREQVAADARQQQGPKPCTAETLAVAWQEFLLKLKTAQKHSALTNFEMMQAEPDADDRIRITCTSDLQLGFLKQERSHLVDHLQQFFNNNNLTIHPVLHESVVEEPAAPRPLSTREQFRALAAKYPQIQELKDRLGLELEY
ncbi:MAG: DNA polymerase III subunit gamma/tau [Lacibacter sp.]